MDPFPLLIITIRCNIIDLSQCIIVKSVDILRCTNCIQQGLHVMLLGVFHSWDHRKRIGFVITPPLSTLDDTVIAVWSSVCRLETDFVIGHLQHTGFAYLEWPLGLDKCLSGRFEIRCHPVLTVHMHIAMFSQYGVVCSGSKIESNLRIDCCIRPNTRSAGREQCPLMGNVHSTWRSGKLLCRDMDIETTTFMFFFCP